VLYPAGRYDPETLRRLATELPLPINAIALPDQDDPASWLGLTARRRKSPDTRCVRGLSRSPASGRCPQFAPGDYFVIAMRCACVPAGSLWAPVTRTVNTPASYEAVMASPVTCAGSWNDRRNDP
jgi:hypothetical protein